MGSEMCIRDRDVTFCGPDMRSALQQTKIIEQADITIVLQSRSDDELAEHVNALIGATLFRRLICCFGPWCESENRNRDLWPEANRVPVRIAARVVEWEVLRIRRGEDAIPPTCSRDEIFAYRLGEPDDWVTPERTGQNAVVIGPDITIRQTTSQILKTLGFRSTHLPLQSSTGRVRVMAKESDAGKIHFVFHDLDPWCDLVRDSVNTARTIFPTAEFIGLASMPDSGLAAEIESDEFVHVVPKLDLEDSLRFQMNDLAPASAD